MEEKVQNFSNLVSLCQSENNISEKNYL